MSISFLNRPLKAKYYGLYVNLTSIENIFLYVIID